MTISTTTARNAYSGSGTTGPFAFTWKIFAAADLRVVKRSAAGAETVLSYPTDYTVSGVGNSSGGSITLTVALATGETLVIRRVPSNVQPTAIRNQGTYFPASIEDQLDRLLMQVQRIQDDVDRSVKIQESFDPAVYALKLTPGETGKALVWQSPTQVGNSTLDSSAVALPGNGRTVATLSAYIANNAIINVKDFGAACDGVTDDGNAVRLALGAIPATGRVTVWFPSDTKLSGVLTVIRDNVTFDGPPGVKLTWASFGTINRGFGFATTMQGGIQADVNGFTLRNLSLIGPRAPNTYFGNDALISSVGASSASRKVGLAVRSAELSLSGAYGVYTQWVDQVVVDDCFIHDCGYCGVQVLSGNKAKINRNRVATIRPGTGGNMYGISFSHDSTNYSSDPNAGTPLAANPFCADSEATGNVVEDINWEGIDCHGGYNIKIHHNWVFNTMHGISASGSSGAASGYAGFGNVVAFNTVDGRNRDGSVSGRENTSYGINASGGATVFNDRCKVVGNVVIAKGVVSSSTTPAINVNRTTNSIVAQNTIKKWGGVGILEELAVNLSIYENDLLELASAGDSVAYGIFGSNPSANLAVCRNRMYANGGTAGRGGFNNSLLVDRPTLRDNDFVAATVSAYFLPAAFTVRGFDMPILPVKDDGTVQATAAIFAGAGAPNNANGSNGNFYFRSDTPGVVNQRIYVKSAGAWVGIL